MWNHKPVPQSSFEERKAARAARIAENKALFNAPRPSTFAHISREDRAEAPIPVYSPLVDDYEIYAEDSIPSEIVTDGGSYNAFTRYSLSSGFQVSCFLIYHEETIEAPAHFEIGTGKAMSPREVSDAVASGLMRLQRDFTPEEREANRPKRKSAYAKRQERAARLRKTYGI